MEEAMESLNYIFKTYEKKIKRLETLTKEGSMRVGRIVNAQGVYLELSDLMVDLDKKLEEFESNLPTDAEGEPVLPRYGEPGYMFRPENVDLFFDGVEAAQH